MKKIILIIKFSYYKISDWFYSRKIKKLSFKQLTNKRIGSGHNIKILIKDSKKRKWVVKFCRNTNNRVPDICEREELTYLFGRILRIPMVHLVVDNSENVKKLIPQGRDFIRDKYVLMPYISGDNLRDFINKGKSLRFLKYNPKTVMNVLVFYHWIGEEDRGLEDVIIYKRKMIFIDHGLAGPGHDKRLRSVHPSPNSYGENDIIRKCFPGKKALVDFIFKDLGINLKSQLEPSVIDFIEIMPKFIISSYIKPFKLKDPNGNDFRSRYKEELINRQKTIRRDFQEWIIKYRQIKEDNKIKK